MGFLELLERGMLGSIQLSKEISNQIDRTEANFDSPLTCWQLIKTKRIAKTFIVTFSSRS
jgi:hypothetical protein